MGKLSRDPEPFLYPLPVALITCGDPGGGSNILAVSWIANVCKSPPMLAISLRPHRYSTSIIQETGEFGVNIPTHAIAYEVDLCGTLSGKDVDKLRVSGLTEMKADSISAPLLEECPVNMECRTHKIIPLGSHILFIADILALHVEEDLCARVEDSQEGSEEDPEERVLEITRARPLLYFPPRHDYWMLGDPTQYCSPSAGKKP